MATGTIMKKDLTMQELLGQRVAVYRNLHTGGFSVQIKGIVVSHLDEIHLRDVQFRVGPKGRERVLREQQKNVHARVYGTVVEKVEVAGEEAYYNPYTTETFVRRETGEALHEAPACTLRENKAYV